MRCTLVNKNTDVLDLELTTENTISGIYSISNIEYAPVTVYAAKINGRPLDRALRHWFRGRSIPSWRKDLENLLIQLDIKGPEELLNKSYGLSLSDQYWLRLEAERIEWKDINFFHHDWDYEAFYDASLGSSSHRSKDISLRTPNNTTSGMLQKAWILDEGRRYLIKGSYYSIGTEPLNEWLATQICDRLGFECCRYDVDIKNRKLISRCENFITEEEELIPAWEILELDKKSNNENDFQHYIRLLESHGIVNAERSVTDMFFVDYLIGNFDRHLNNFGVIRNAETLEWKRTAPVFDCGEAMCCDVTYTPDANLARTNVKFFSNTNMPIKKLPEKLDFSGYDLTPLKGLTEAYHKKILEYRDYLNYDDEKFRRILHTFSLRIKDHNYDYDMVMQQMRQDQI